MVQRHRLDVESDYYSLTDVETDDEGDRHREFVDEEDELQPGEPPVEPSINLAPRELPVT